MVVPSAFRIATNSLGEFKTNLNTESRFGIRVDKPLSSSVYTVELSAEIKEGVGLQSLMTFSVGFSPLLIFIASFFNKKSDWKYTTLDIWCGVLSVVGIILWLITSNAVLAIIFSILSDLIASIPTLIKSWKAPQTENHLPFTLSTFNALITLATIKSWTFVHYAFPVYIFLICITISLLINGKLGLKIIKR